MHNQAFTKARRRYCNSSDLLTRRKEEPGGLIAPETVSQYVRFLPANGIDPNGVRYEGLRGLTVPS